MMGRIYSFDVDGRIYPFDVGRDDMVLGLKKGGANYAQAKGTGMRPSRSTSKPGRSQGNQDQTAVTKRPRRTGQK